MSKTIVEPNIHIGFLRVLDFGDSHVLALPATKLKWVGFWWTQSCISIIFYRPSVDMTSTLHM